MDVFVFDNPDLLRPWEHYLHAWRMLKVHPMLTHAPGRQRHELLQFGTPELSFGEYFSRDEHRLINLMTILLSYYYRTVLSLYSHMYAEFAVWAR